MDGTTDQDTGLPYIAKGTSPSSDPSYQVQYQRRESRQNAVLGPWREGQVVGEGSLDIGVYPIDYTLGGERKHFAGATAQAVADYSTKYVYVDDANSLQIADSFPTDVTAFLPLAKVTTGGGVMTIEDRRTWTVHAVPEFAAVRAILLSDGPGSNSAGCPVGWLNPDLPALAGEGRVSHRLHL